MTASSNISPASSKKKNLKKIKITLWKLSLKFTIWLKLLPTFMVNFGYPYNDSHMTICKDSTDYLWNFLPV